MCALDSDTQMSSRNALNLQVSLAAVAESHPPLLPTAPQRLGIGGGDQHLVSDVEGGVGQQRKGFSVIYSACTLRPPQPRGY